MTNVYEPVAAATSAIETNVVGTNVVASSELRLK